jgi:hypothetical protein
MATTVLRMFLQFLSSSDKTRSVYKDYIYHLGELIDLYRKKHCDSEMTMRCEEHLRGLDRMADEVVSQPKHPEALKLAHSIYLEFASQDLSRTIYALNYFSKSQLYVKKSDIPDEFQNPGFMSEFVCLSQLFEKVGAETVKNLGIKVTKSAEPRHKVNDIISVNLDHTTSQFEIGGTVMHDEVSPGTRLVLEWEGGSLFVQEKDSNRKNHGSIKVKQRHFMKSDEMLMIGDCVLKVVGLTSDRLEISLDSQTKVLSPTDKLTIGRSPTCNFSLQDSSVSKQHCKVFWVREGWVIEDLGSTNGVWLCLHTQSSLNRNEPSALRPIRLDDCLSFSSWQFKLIEI